MPLRELWLTSETRASRPSDWSDDRRREYLLAPSVTAPFSVDRQVWPEAEAGTLVFVSFVAAQPSDEEALGDWNRVDAGPDLELLGYDVADNGMLSGLMNCGYEASEREAAQAKWRGALNEHHLFAAVADALAFRTYAEARVPEHAPFFVYGLYTPRA